MSHTPTPWKYTQESIDPEWAIVTDASGHIIANVNSETGPDIPPLVSTKMPRDANAAHIVRCVNNHDALLAALKGLIGECGDLEDGSVAELQCHWCGRDYEDAPSGSHCTADDCPGYQARQAIQTAEA